MKIQKLGSQVAFHQWLHCTARPQALPRVLTHEMCVSTLERSVMLCRSDSGASGVAVYSGTCREWWGQDMASVLEGETLTSPYVEGGEHTSPKAFLWDEGWLEPGAVLQHVYVLEDGSLPPHLPEGVGMTLVPSLHPSRIWEAMEEAKAAQQAAFVAALGWD